MKNPKKAQELFESKMESMISIDGFLSTYIDFIL